MAQPILYATQTKSH